jgi:hypothetical protein
MMREHQLPMWECPRCERLNHVDLVNCPSCNCPHPLLESYADVTDEDYHESEQPQPF